MSSLRHEADVARLTEDEISQFVRHTRRGAGGGDGAREVCAIEKGGMSPTRADEPDDDHVTKLAIFASSRAPKVTKTKLSAPTPCAAAS